MAIIFEVVSLGNNFYFYKILAITLTSSIFFFRICSGEWNAFPESFTSYRFFC